MRFPFLENQINLILLFASFFLLFSFDNGIDKSSFYARQNENIIYMSCIGDYSTKVVEINWLANSKDIQSFILEKSADGKVFYEISKTSIEQENVVCQFSISDINPFEGRSYYRLKTIFLTEKENISSSIFWDFNIAPQIKSDLIDIIKTNQSYLVLFNSSTDDNYLLSLYTKSGILEKKMSGMCYKGLNCTSINASDLVEDEYVAVLQIDNSKTQKEFLR